MIECIENQQTKKHIFEPDQKYTKKIKRSFENKWMHNSEYTYQIRIHVKRPIAETAVRRYPVNKVLLEISQSS